MTFDKHTMHGLGGGGVLGITLNVLKSKPVSKSFYWFYILVTHGL